MTTTREVRIWAVRRNASSKRTSYEIRWVVGRRECSKSFARKALADGFRSDLIQAMSAGELFEVESGLPVSMARRLRSMSWYELACAYVVMKWPGAAANSRASMVDALATVTPSFGNGQGKGASTVEVRRALIGYAFNPGADEPPADVRRILQAVEKNSLPVSDLADPDRIRRGLNGLTLTLAGGAAAATTVARKRAVLYNVLKYAVRELHLLDVHPMADIDWSPPEEVAEQVDRRVVVNPSQARELLTAVTYVGRRRGERLRAFFGCLFFGGMRPSEAMSLRRSDCVLPEEGWGRVVLSITEPEVGKRFTDSGESRDRRGLKHRARKAVRPVPIPPELVQLLREHLDRFGSAEDGRLFRTSKGVAYTSSAYYRVWRVARSYAFTPEQLASPLAGRPYDLRHAAVSLWLNAGVPAQEVADRVGHSVEVLWKVYAGTIDGDEDRLNRMIELALAA